MPKYAAIAIALVAANALAFGADLKGTYDSCCQSVAFRLASSSSQQPKGEIALRAHLGSLFFGPYLAGADWWNAQGQHCPKTGECEQIETEKLQFLKVTRKRVSGNYALEFNGRRVQGQFSVKWRHEGKRCICE